MHGRTSHSPGFGCFRSPLAVAGVLAAILILATGCSTVRYFHQAARGQLEIFRRQRPIAAVLASSTADSKLKQRLNLVLELREFAEHELGLDPGRHYLKYADLERRYVVWNVYAAPEFSLEPKSWWYPVVGRLKYRGFFSEAEARKCGDALAAKGHDVYVGGVQAYSTLGWFHDPVLNTFIFDDEIDLVELIFHELAHQRVFASGDTDFNEAFATATAEEGLHRWMLAHGSKEEYAEYVQSLHRKRQFIQLLATARDQLKQVYGETTEDDEKHPEVVHSPNEAASLREQKQRIFSQLQRDYTDLKQRWCGADEYDRWISRSVNNAKLTTVETYYRLVPAFHELLRRQNGDLAGLFAEAERLADLPKDRRHALLENLLNSAGRHPQPSSQ